MTMTIRTFIEAMPKAENHYHFDGGTYPASALELAKRNNVKIPFSNVEEAEELYKFDCLDDFIRTINTVCSVILTAEDFEYLTIEIAKDAKRQNILYREVMFSCGYHEQRGIPFTEIMKGFIAGRRVALKKYGVFLAGIPALDRTMNPEENLAFIDRIVPFREEAGLVAVGLDSTERGYPAHLNAAAFARAGELGFGRTAHAGEDDGPSSVADTLDSLGADRIDHGVRAIEDPQLVARLAREKILLTVCPISNVRLKVYPDMARHSFKRLYDAGVPVSVNSDDPPFFQGDLNDNYVSVVEAFGLSMTQLLEIAKNAFLYSFAPADVKARGVTELDTYFNVHKGLW